MGAVRTQIYLTQDQRRKLDARRKRERKTLAALIREAIDAYLDEGRVDVKAILDATFGASPNFEVPPRSEWANRERRIWADRD